MDKKSWGWYALFGALYFAQGVSGFFVNATLLYVMYKQGWTKSMGGDFLAVAMLPWTWKIVLAPIVDRWRIAGSMGSKPGWIMVSTLAAVASLLALPLAGTWFPCVLSLVVLHNVARSVQDIAVDGWAVEICGPKKSRPVNAAMNVGRALGGLAGGGGAMYLLAVMSWPAVCVIAATVSGGAVIAPLYLLWRSGWRSSAEVVSSEATGVKWIDFFGAFRGVGPFALVMAALLIHVPEGMTGPIVYKWFIGLGHDDAHVAWITSWASTAKIAGSLAIGLVTAWMARAFARRPRLMMVDAEVFEKSSRKPEWLLPTAIVAKCLGYIAIGMLVGQWWSDGAVFVMVMYTSVMDVVVVVLFCAAAMEICDKKVAATQFAAYMAIMNICTVWTSWAGGQLAEAFSGVGLALLDFYVNNVGIGVSLGSWSGEALAEMFSTAGLFLLSGLAGMVVLIPLGFVFYCSHEGSCEQ